MAKPHRSLNALGASRLSRRRFLAASAGAAAGAAAISVLPNPAVAEDSGRTVPPASSASSCTPSGTSSLGPRTLAPA
jgi:TAT (twin-arginine translocation) pathway signal sequence.